MHSNKHGNGVCMPVLKYCVVLLTLLSLLLLPIRSSTCSATLRRHNQIQPPMKNWEADSRKDCAMTRLISEHCIGVRGIIDSALPPGFVSRTPPPEHPITTIIPSYLVATLPGLLSLSTFLGSPLFLALYRSLVSSLHRCLIVNNVRAPQ